VQGHLAAQDELLSRIAAKIGLNPVPVIDNPELDETANPDRRDPQAQRQFLARIDTYRDEGPPPAEQRMSREEIRTQFGV